MLQSEIQQQHSSPSDQHIRMQDMHQGEKAVLNNTRVRTSIYEGSENLRKISRSNTISQKKLMNKKILLT